MAIVETQISKKNQTKRVFSTTPIEHDGDALKKNLGGNTNKGKVILPIVNVKKNS